MKHPSQRERQMSRYQRPSRRHDTFAIRRKEFSTMNIQLARLAGVVALMLISLQPCMAEDEAGFEPLFDGKTLDRWDGSPELWKVQNGVIRGATLESKPLKANEFLIWKGEVADFVLRLEFRVADRGAGNSGVQYRSHRVPEAGRWVVGGYQIDIERTNKYMGILYEERGRGILALRGEQVLLSPATQVTGPRATGDGANKYTKKVTGQVGNPDEIVRGVRAGEWQSLEVSAIGNEHVHRLNSHITVRVTDEDTAHSASRGLLALQLHQGAAMQIEFRNIRLKQLSSMPADATE